VITNLKDWLASLGARVGSVRTPNREQAAAGASKMDTPQRTLEIGAPIPIVFARRRNNAGGILISPGATEARFTNGSTNRVTASYHLVLSEGVIDSIPVKDVYQRYCRVGTYNQSYNRRAGTWEPGNFIVQRTGYELPDCPQYCGSVGFYTGMSTMSFQSPSYPDGSDLWNRQVHAFIRGGINLTRLFDNTSGASDNFADLVKWIWTNSARVPSLLIDDGTLQDAAVFLEANGLTCNCYLTESQNVGDLITKWAPYFLLSESNINGKRGLRPVLPVTSLGAINTGTIAPEYLFTENEIIPGSFEVEYTSVTERQPFVAQVIWRQQPDDDIGIVRTAEVRYSGTATNGPYESHDLSAFCTSEAHAVKIGAYILAKRLYTSHTLRFTARPQQHNTVLSPGSIVRVKLARDVANAGSTYHDWLYQVDRISRSLAGDVSYECSQFPIDSSGRSLVALAVTTVGTSGTLLASNRSGLSCDVNSSTNNTIPSDTGLPGVDLNTDVGDLTFGGGTGGNQDSQPPSDNTQTADDGLDSSTSAPVQVVNPRNAGVPAVGGGIVADPVCPAGTTYTMKWYRNDAEVAGIVGNVYVIGTADIQVGGSRIKGIWYCTNTSTGAVTQIPTDVTFIPEATGSIAASGRVLRYSGTYIKSDVGPYIGFAARDVPTVVVEGYDASRNFVAGIHANTNSPTVGQQWSQYWAKGVTPSVQVSSVEEATSYAGPWSAVWNPSDYIE
jgi:hypothetical protein